MQGFKYPIIAIFILGLFASGAAQAQKRSEDKNVTCSAMDRPCLMKQVESLANQVDKTEWKDQTLRELAKTYTYEGKSDKAIALIDQITQPDTKAMTIRGIGMAAANGKWDRHRYDVLFGQLAEEAQKITHPPSKGIAFTYIAMSQAFAGDDDGARKTAATIENGALRNKALGETAEIEAERGDLKNALASLQALDSTPYTNKAYDTVSRIFLDKAMIEEAYTCATRIDNAYLKAKSIQRILNKGNAEETDLDPHEDLLKGLE